MTDEVFEHLGDRLKFSCQRVGGVAKAAKLTGVGESTFYTWFTGDRSPSIEATICLARGGNLDLLWLITGKSDSAQPSAPPEICGDLQMLRGFLLGLPLSKDLRKRGTDLVDELIAKLSGKPA